ncbi:DNA topoisomerase 3 [Halomonas elongata]|uniref:DNA topoisomerase 3 n=1 Tax=Halomonas elongata TaxID=2746 RepID=A0A1B8NXZ6_HALEL|nr:toprim domain-containing protein [Halomonas elongata]OBX34886.1 DNA topoisomerase 3 [Halomonas elongata]
MSRLFLCEKPSQGREIAQQLGATQKGNGCLQGNGVTVTWVFGHLLEPAPPEAYNPDLKRWTLEALPILPAQWKLEVKPSAKKQFNVIKKLLGSASEVVIATDAEREGELIAREVLEACRFSGRCHACGCHHSMTPVSARHLMTYSRERPRSHSIKPRSADLVATGWWV